MRAKLVDEKWQNERNQISQEGNIIDLYMFNYLGERKRILDFELLLKNKTKIGVNPNEQEIKTSK